MHFAIRNNNKDDFDGFTVFTKNNKMSPLLCIFTIYLSAYVDTIFVLILTLRGGCDCVHRSFTLFRSVTEAEQNVGLTS